MIYVNIEQFKTILVDTQPYAVTPHSRISLELGEDWSHATTHKDTEDIIDAFVTTGENRFQLTTGALMSLASTLQMGKDMLFSSPAELVEPLLNWWFSTIPDEDSPAFTLGRNDVVTAVVKPNGELPEFPVFYIDAIVEELRTSLGASEFFVHPWYLSTTKETFCIIYSDVVSATVSGDAWHGGVVFKMSSAGAIVPTVSMALVRPSDNAVIIPPDLDYRYKRGTHGQGVTNTQTWVQDSVGFLCALMSMESGVLEKLAEHDSSQHTGTIISDIMREISLPRIVQSFVLDHAVDNDDPTGYGILNDILAALDYTEDSVYDDKINEKIMRAAGSLWIVLDSRCESCHQMFH